MKKIIILILIILNIIFIIPTKAKERSLILSDKVIVIDPGHGGKDNGTTNNNVIEKEINLKISKYLSYYLQKYGATVYLTREDDYDLSFPKANRRKKSDFDNRIKLINEYNPDLVISIHQNYYKDPKYSGTQIFYKNNAELAKKLQNKLNDKRLAKPISNTLYMYNKINGEVLLIECGFLSNSNDRKNLTNEKYIEKYANKIALNLREYHKDY